MGRHTHIVWLWINNNGHRFGLAGLDGMAAAEFSVVKQRWNWVLGGISLAFAVWGILSFFPGEGILRQATLGGRIGQSIIMHSPNIVGGLRVAGLVLLGIIFVIPRKCWSAAKNSWRLLTKVFRLRPRVVFPRSRQVGTKAIPLEATSPEVGAVR